MEYQFTKEQLNYIKTQYNTTSTRNIAKEFGVDRCVISRRLKQMGVPLKSPGNILRYPAIDGKKICSICKKEKPSSEFYEHKNKTPHTYCRTCECEKARKNRLSKRYNISNEDYETRHKNQNGVCAICGKPETQERKGSNSQLSVDHNHITGKIRGLLCSHCNLGIGCFEDSYVLLQKAIVYLRQENYDET